MNDLKFALRQLIKNPGFTLVAVLTLALGIGANATLFTVIDAVLLKPLPFEKPDRLVVIDQKGDFGAFSGGDFRDLREQSRSFREVAATSAGSMNLAGDGDPVRINSARVSANLFATLGKSPILGRTFSLADEKPGAEPVVAISHGLWLSRFGGDPNVIGRSIRLDARGYTIIAVMPPGFSYPDTTEVWAPLSLGQAELDDYLAYFLSLVARIKPELTLAQADAELRTITSRNGKKYPDFRSGWTLVTVPLHDSLVGKVRRPLLTLQGAVAFVLFIACANVANLLLVRATRRQRELALGASRMRLVRQLLVESGLLAALGCVAGLFLAGAGPAIARALLPAGLAQLNPVAMDGRAFIFSLVLSALTAVVFGLVPAWQMRQISLHESIKQSAATGSSRAETHRLRAGLVIAEFAVTMVLLAGAGLLIKSFFTLRSVTLGFEPRQVLTGCVELPERAYPTPERRLEFQRELIERVQSLPGVQAAGIISRLPLSGGNIGGLLEIEGMPAPEFKPGGDMRAAGIRSVSPGYFNAMSIPLLRGRALAETDRHTARPVAVINEAMARKYWPKQEAVGRRVKPTILDLPWLEIVGVVGDVRHQSLDQRPEPELYVTLSQSPPNQVNLVVRTASDPKRVAASIRRVVSGLDSDQPVHRLSTMEKLVDDAGNAPRFRTLLLSAFGGLALVLAAIGIYGVISFSVAQRRQEIGIRIALGAQSGDILRLVVGEGIGLIAAGGVIGFAATLALTRLLQGFLYEVRPTDPGTLVTVAAVLGAVGLFACWLPACRATRVDPMKALRYE